MLKLKVILGSTRPGRFSEKLIFWLKEQLAEQPEFEVEFLDLRDYELPFLDQSVSPKNVTDGNYPNERVREWGGKIKEADAFLIISPEYNHGVSAVLKNAFDSIFWEWDRKPIAFVGYGVTGASQAITALRVTAIEMGMAPIRLAVHLPGPWDLMDESDQIKKGILGEYNGVLQKSLGQLVWWAAVLKEARGRG